MSSSSRRKARRPRGGLCSRAARLRRRRPAFGSRRRRRTWTIRCSAAVARTAAKEDGSFQLTGLAGRRLLRAGNLPPGWTLKAVRLNGDDVTDAGVEFKPGQDVSGLEIVATSKQTEISGTVTTLERLADQGLHGRGLLGRFAALEPAVHPLGDRHAAGPGRPVPRPQHAAGKLQHHRGGLHRGGRRGATPSCSSASRHARSASRCRRVARRSWI